MEKLRGKEYMPSTAGADESKTKSTRVNAVRKM